MSRAVDAAWGSGLLLFTDVRGRIVAERNGRSRAGGPETALTDVAVRVVPSSARCGSSARKGPLDHPRTSVRARGSHRGDQSIAHTKRQRGFGLALLAARYGLWADVLLAILAGALGGTLSGVIRLRAPQRRLAALKNLGLVMLVQPLFGAVGGIILFAIWRSGLLSIAGLDEDDWASVVVVAFAGGFSEPFFLKSLARITGSPDRARETQQTTID